MAAGSHPALLALLLTLLPLGTTIVLVSPRETTSVQTSGLRSVPATDDGFTRARMSAP